MISIRDINNNTVTFPKSSILKIVSVDNNHTVYFIDGSNCVAILDLTEFKIILSQK